MMLVPTKLFNITVSDFDAKKSAGYNWMLVVTEFIAKETQCNTFFARSSRVLVVSGTQCKIRTSWVM